MGGRKTYMNKQHLLYIPYRLLSRAPWHWNLSRPNYSCAGQWGGSKRKLSSTRDTENENDRYANSNVSIILNPDFARFQINIQLGIYHVYWQELTRLFPRNQILALQNEAFNDESKTLRTVYSFLQMRK